MICFDTQILIWGIQGVRDPTKIQMVERTQRYIARLDKDKKPVMVPAPALTEYLAGFDPAEQERQMAVLERCFIIPSFDAPAAAMAARILAQRDLVRNIA